MMDKIILAGFGGQGVMFIGKVLAVAGMVADLEVCWIPSYGPEMRGGTANCSVILSDREIYSPVIDKADYGIVLNQPSYDKFLPRIKSGGTLVVNTSLVNLDTVRDDVNIIGLRATDLAYELGNANVANMVCLGALLPYLQLTDYAKVEKALEQVVGSNKKELLELNIAAVKKGMKRAVDN
ncbi:MAG: 2-oxoacid:ferredoxin oxidoreductase subunit gamma [Clostridia bacterium]|nr:2-oxoacid:ferredoxin oxidoreductase subunit gamma [Clostridia bacterium]